jgi:hypothetical protein
VAIERYHLKTVPTELAKVRVQAESIEAAFSAIAKEQDQLANQHGKVKYLDFETELLAKCELAHNQREDNHLGELKEIVNQALVSGAKTKNELISDLQQVTDLKEAHTKLDKDVEVHHINGTLDGLEQEKKEAKTPDELLNVIGKEQEFLSELHNNIKYPEQHAYIIEKCELAHGQKHDNHLGELKEIANQALVSGAKTKNELISDLQQVTDLKETHTKLDKDVERHRISGTLDGFKEEKQGAKSSDKVLSAIAKEQEFLSGLHNNIKYPEQHDNIIEKCELAHGQKQDNHLGSLKEIVNQALISGAKNEKGLVSDLQQGANLKELYTKIDKDIETHGINSTLGGLTQEKQDAKTPDQVLNIMTKEQEFLSELPNNIKYFKEHEVILSKCALVCEQKENNDLGNLKVLVSQSLISGVKTKEELASYLQQVTNPKEAHVKLDKDIEANDIRSNLKEIAVEKRTAITATAALHAIKKEPNYLGGLHGNIKYPEHHDDKLIDSINNAHKLQKSSAMNDLSKATQFLDKAKFSDSNSIANIIKHSDDPMDAHKTLITKYHDHILSQVHKALDIIEEKGHLTINRHDNSHKFDCPTKFMEYMTNEHTHEYTPHKQLQQIQNKVIEHHKMLEMSKGMEMEL